MKGKIIAAALVTFYLVIFGIQDLVEIFVKDESVANKMDKLSSMIVRAECIYLIWFF